MLRPRRLTSFKNKKQSEENFTFGAYWNNNVERVTSLCWTVNSCLVVRCSRREVGTFYILRARLQTLRYIFSLILIQPCMPSNLHTAWACIRVIPNPQQSLLPTLPKYLRKESRGKTAMKLWIPKPLTARFSRFYVWACDSSSVCFPVWGTPLAC